jgi:hypothetical protein
MQTQLCHNALILYTSCKECIIMQFSNVINLMQRTLNNWCNSDEYKSVINDETFETLLSGFICLQFKCSCVGTISEIPWSLSLNHRKSDISVFWTTAHFRSSYSMYICMIKVETSIIKILDCRRKVSGAQKIPDNIFYACHSSAMFCPLGT